MREYFISHTKYSRNLKLSIILSQTLFICLFYFFPRLTSSTTKISYEPIILIDEVPITVQRNDKFLLKPSVPQISIDDNLKELEILADVKIVEDSKNEQNTGKIYSAISTPSYIPTSPRLILEVLPQQNKDNISGSIKLKLRINEIGSVIDHKILSSSLQCDECLTEILAAAYKSKWEPNKTSKNNAENWVEKTYSFY